MKKLTADIGPDTPFAEAARLVVSRLCRQMMENLPGALDGEDIEALHDLRVASRRMRAALRVFRPCLKKKKVSDVIPLVRSVTASSGTVRDQDVFLDYLRSRDSSDGESSIGWLVEREEKIREGARLAMIDSLRQLKESGLADKIEDLLAGLKKKCDSDRSSFAAHAPEMFQQRLDEIRSLSDAIEDPSDSERLHAMRIAAKRLRYTMEVFVPCFGKPLANKIEAIKLLQDQLGLIHDCDVWTEKLRQYRGEPGLSEERQAAVDELVDELTRRREEVYREAAAHWRSLAGARFADELLKLARTPVTRQGSGQEDGEVEKMKKKGAKDSAESSVQAETTPAEASAASGDIEAAVREVREAMTAATARLAGDGEPPAKLAKQLAKVSELLDALPGHAAGLPPDDAAKAVRRLAKLKEEFSVMASEDGAPDTDLKKFRRRIRSLRKKIGAGAVERQQPAADS